MLDDIWSSKTVEGLDLLHELVPAQSCVLITTRDDTLLASTRNVEVICMESQKKPSPVRDDQRSAAELRALYAQASDDQLSASQLRSRYAAAHVEKMEDVGEESGLSAKWLLAETMEEVTDAGIICVDDDDEVVHEDFENEDEEGLGFVRLDREKAKEEEEQDGFDVREELEKSLKESETVARSEIEESNDIAVEEMHLAKRMYEQMIRSVGSDTVMSTPLSVTEPSLRNSLASSSSHAPSRAFWYKNVNVKIIPHHMGIPYTAGIGSHIPPPAVLEAKLQGASEKGEDSSVSRRVAIRLIVRDVAVEWRLFGGFDWNASLQVASSQDGDGGGKKEELLRLLLEDDAEKGVGFGKRDVRTRVAKRDLSAMMEVDLRGFNAMVDTFVEGSSGKGSEEVSTSVALAVRDVEITDHLESSPINKLLSFWVSETKHPRVTGSSMVRLSVDVMNSSAMECKIRLAVLPLRLHLDQDAVDFALNFFTFQSVDIAEQQPTHPPSQAIVLTTKGGDAQEDAAHEEIYFQAIDIRAFKIKIDYWPKRINFSGLKQGNSFEMINLFAYEALEVSASCSCALYTFALLMVSVISTLWI